MGIIGNFIGLTNMFLQINENLKVINDNFMTNVTEGFVEAVKEFIFEYKSWISDIHILFFKQAGKGNVIDIKL